MGWWLQYKENRYWCWKREARCSFKLWAAHRWYLRNGEGGSCWWCFYSRSVHCHDKHRNGLFAAAVFVICIVYYAIFRSVLLVHTTWSVSREGAKFRKGDKTTHPPRLTNCIYLPKTRMQRIIYPAIALFLVSLSSCEVIGGIFKAGVWTGLILVAIVVALVIFLITRFRKWTLSYIPNK